MILQSAASSKQQAAGSRCAVKSVQVHGHARHCSHEHLVSQISWVSSSRKPTKRVEAHRNQPAHTSLYTESLDGMSTLQPLSRSKVQIPRHSHALSELSSEPSPKTPNNTPLAMWCLGDAHCAIPSRQEQYTTLCTLHPAAPPIASLK